jgi:hypothetical protein
VARKKMAEECALSALFEVVIGWYKRKLNVKVRFMKQMGTWHFKWMMFSVLKWQLSLVRGVFFSKKRDT